LGIMARRRTRLYALIGAVLGLAPAWPAAVFNAYHATEGGSRELSDGQFASALLAGAIPVIVVCAVIGGAVGMLVSTRRRSSELPASETLGLPPSVELDSVGRRLTFLLSGLALTVLLWWAEPRLLLYPSIGAAMAWVVTRITVRIPIGGALLLGGFLGSLAHYWEVSSTQQVALLSYFMHRGVLGIVIALLVGTVQALGPAMLILGLTPSGYSRRGST
jgi:hypothetical protein